MGAVLHPLVALAITSVPPTLKTSEGAEMMENKLFFLCSLSSPPLKSIQSLFIGLCCGLPQGARTALHPTVEEVTNSCERVTSVSREFVGLSLRVLFSYQMRPQRHSGGRVIFGKATSERELAQTPGKMPR